MTTHSTGYNNNNIVENITHSKDNEERRRFAAAKNARKKNLSIYFERDTTITCSTRLNKSHNRSWCCVSSPQRFWLSASARRKRKETKDKQKEFLSAANVRLIRIYDFVIFFFAKHKLTGINLLLLLQWHRLSISTLDFECIGGWKRFLLNFVVCSVFFVRFVLTRSSLLSSVWVLRYLLLTLAFAPINSLNFFVTFACFCLPTTHNYLILLWYINKSIKIYLPSLTLWGCQKVKKFKIH